MILLPLAWSQRRDSLTTGDRGLPSHATIGASIAGMDPSE